MKKINLSRFSLRIFKYVPKTEIRITIPTLFTLARIIVVPIIIIAMLGNIWSIAFFFFIFACLTDLIDGFLARLLNEKTFLGAFLDPIADKLLLISCFSTLAFISNPLFSIPYWFVYFIISKEIIQCLGAALIYYRLGFLDIRPTLLGKITTALQMIFIIWLFACYFFCWVPITTYYTMLSIMIFCIGSSFIQYVRIGWNSIKKAGNCS